ncbi:MAG: nitroreductase family deazaflavin-dependent oxidoreductase [Acidimicrobiia bacterium]
MSDWNAGIIEEFRANDGAVGGHFADRPILLLHTTGARSGLERLNPLTYLEHQGRVFVFATKAGSDSSPDWYYNLVANPDVTVEMGTETVSKKAVPLSEPERSKIYGIQAAYWATFADYEEKTDRVIPVVELV